MTGRRARIGRGVPACLTSCSDELAPNAKHRFTGDPRLREALGLAIEKTSDLEAVSAGLAVPAARRKSDAARRAALRVRAQRLLYDAVALIPLDDATKTHAIFNNVRGVVLTPFGDTEFRFASFSPGPLKPVR